MRQAGEEEHLHRGEDEAVSDCAEGREEGMRHEALRMEGMRGKNDDDP